MTDWFRLIADLDRVGVSNKAVAEKVGVAPSSLAAWKRGSEPLHSHGESLKALHAQHCEIQKTES